LESSIARSDEEEGCVAKIFKLIKMKRILQLLQVEQVEDVLLLHLKFIYVANGPTIMMSLKIFATQPTKLSVI
jgi:hypothetical protein